MNLDKDSRSNRDEFFLNFIKLGNLKSICGIYKEKLSEFIHDRGIKK